MDTYEHKSLDAKQQPSELSLYPLSGMAPYLCLSVFICG